MDTLRKKINLYWQQGVPFVFCINFDKTGGFVIPVENINKEELLFDISGYKNSNIKSNRRINLKKNPVDYPGYLNRFNPVMKHINAGNTFLLNLSFETPVFCDASLREVFFASTAKYKMWHKNRFVVFSPECFITIKEGVISTFPMKGTIDAALPDAASQLLNDSKEKAEHATIVDLLRNDLSRIADDVQVKRFRYIDKITAGGKYLLQVSSVINGKLKSRVKNKPGDVLFSMMPAGSVTGAPKKKTVEIIREVENHYRGFYTGVLGWGDGTSLDSGVIIRYIEQRDGKLFYKSGGGLTFMSDPEKEYNELIDKIYVPFG